MGKSVATGEKVLRCCFHISLRGSLKDSAFLSVIYKKKNLWELQNSGPRSKKTALPPKLVNTSVLRCFT